MLSVETPNCFCIVGIATLTMLVSRVDMNIPMTTTASGTTQPGLDAALPGPGRTAAGGGDCLGGAGGSVGVGLGVAGRVSASRERKVTLPRVPASARSASARSGLAVLLPGPV